MNLKKILLCVLSVCTALTQLNTTISVNASEAENNDIKEYIVSGSGTYDDPYVLGGDNQFKTYFDNMAKESVNPTVMPALDFSGVLDGSNVIQNQTYGGKWSYSSGGMTAITNNALVVLGVAYGAPTYAQRLKQMKSSSLLFDTLQDGLISGLVGTGLIALIERKVDLTEEQEEAIRKIFAFVFISVAGLSLDDQRELDSAANTSKGILEIQYKTSWNGAWYKSSCLDVWESYPTVYLPNTTYGIGGYSPY